MNTIDATVSMLKTMPEDAVELVFRFTENLFHTQTADSPYAPVTLERVLADLEESRREIEAGKGTDMRHSFSHMETPSDAEVMEVSRKLMEQYHDAYAALAQ